MKILITGGTGFIGKELYRHLHSKHELVVLTRDPIYAFNRLGHDVITQTDLSQLENLNDFDAIINLAGEPLGNKRWTAKQRQLICESRWTLTSRISQLIQHSSTPPHTVISGSAIGYYGNRDAQQVAEEDAPVEDFLNHICEKWERLARQAENPLTRVCVIRTGVVLGKEGLLNKMLPPFKMGLGGPLGSGEQYLSWIHIDDMVRAIIYLLEHRECQGPFNLTAPEPIDNRTFSKSLGKVLHRPVIFKVPEWVLKTAMGDLADLALGGQNVYPRHLLEAGFHFHFKEIEPALEDLLDRKN